MTRSKTNRLTLSGAASLLALSFAVGNAYAEEKQFDIEAQPLAKALLEFNEQSGLTVAAPRDLVQGKNAPAVQGEMEPDEALERILAGTGLKSNELPTGAYTITVASVEETDSTQNSFRVAELDKEETVREVERSQERDDEEERQDVIVVTGTSIRGLAPESSPTRTYSREEIDMSGAATAQDFIQTLPQNFGGGSNLSTSTIGGLPNDDGSFFNNPAEGGSAGASVNLRGLGSGSTLVLLNGHRLAPSSGIGDFVDISMIPASALERVEVLTDGASSIYGGDAVAGVVNFILRDDFDGVEASARYGSVTEGDMAEYRTSLAAGESWDAGQALLVYEYFKRDNLSAGDRSFSSDAALPTDLLPRQLRHSLLASASQDVAPDLKLFGDILFSTKDVRQNSTTTSSGVRETSSTSNNWNVSAGAEWRLANNWYIDFSGSFAELKSDTSFVATTSTVEREVDSTLWTLDAKASGAAFSIPGGDVKVAFGGHYRSEDFSNTVSAGSGNERSASRDVYALFGEIFVPLVGPANAMPGIERFEINASGRFDDFSDFGSTVNPKIGALWSPAHGLNLRSSYSTSFNPPPLGRVGATDFSGLAVNMSLLNAGFGLTPGDPSIANAVLLSLNGTDKNLDAEESRALTAGLDYTKEWSNQQFTVRSTYFDIEFEDRLGDTPCAQCTNNVFFDIPNIAFNSPDLFPEGTVVFFPTIDQINEALNSLDTPVTALAGANPLNAEILLFANVVRNLSLTHVKGTDFEIDYTIESDAGVFSLGLDGTYLTEFQQQAANTSPSVDLLNVQFNPVDLTLRGRAGFSRNGFASNLFVNYVDSYRSDNTSSSVPIDSWKTIDLTLSYDTQQKFDNGFLNNTVVRLSVINLLDEAPPATVDNPSFNITGYDPTNASPLGRFVSLELTKRF